MEHHDHAVSGGNESSTTNGFSSAQSDVTSIAIACCLQIPLFAPWHYRKWCLSVLAAYLGFRRAKKWKSSSESFYQLCHQMLYNVGALTVFGSKIYVAVISWFFMYVPVGVSVHMCTTYWPFLSSGEVGFNDAVYSREASRRCVGDTTEVFSLKVRSESWYVSNLISGRNSGW